MEFEREYWPDGHLRYEHTYQNGKRHGIHKGWYENGQLKYEWLYQNNGSLGIRKGWYEDGQLAYKEYYLYGNQVSEEEYRKHQLITKLAGISDEV